MQFYRHLRGVLALGMVCAANAGGVQAAPAAISLPDIVSIPKSLNLGSTSFFDGFGNVDGGWTWLQYGRYEDIGRINDARGEPSPYFKGANLQVFAALTQFSYTTPWHPSGGDGVGFSALLPLSNVAAHFATDSPVRLADNGFNLGDMGWGPIYQSRRYMQDGRVIFSWRFQLLVMSPSGGFNPHRDINQSAGYWGINPYIAFTYLPTPRLEFSSRINYQYNFSTSRFANPPPIPGVIYVSGQAGDLVYSNFASSYQVSGKLHLGVNGYGLDQLTPDQANGHVVAASRASALYLGPGGRYVFNKANTLNVNVYLPVQSRNASSGPALNFQYVHRF